MLVRAIICSSVLTHAGLFARITHARTWRVWEVSQKEELQYSTVSTSIPGNKGHVICPMTTGGNPHVGSRDARWIRYLPRVALTIFVIPSVGSDAE